MQYLRISYVRSRDPPVEPLILILRIDGDDSRHDIAEAHISDPHQTRAECPLVRRCCSRHAQFVTKPKQTNRITMESFWIVNIGVSVSDRGHETHHANEDFIIMERRDSRVEFSDGALKFLPRDGVKG